MFIGYVVVAVLLTLAMGASAFLTFTRNEALVKDLRRMGVPDSWLPRLASLKVAGALGLVAGLFVPALGAAAAAGTTLYFIGAVITHLRAKDYAIAPPVVLTLLAVAALVLRLASA